MFYFLTGSYDDDSFVFGFATLFVQEQQQQQQQKQLNFT
jgi:hypothetical protein